MSNQSIHNILKSSPLIPVVTFQKEDDPIELMKYLLGRNIFCIEVTLRTTYGLKSIEVLKKEYGDTIQIGAGTVINEKQIEQLKKVEADFMVSPGLSQKLFDEMKLSNIPFLPGVSTPSEMIQAQEYGLQYLKFFPANIFGGLAALKIYGNLFPDISFCPTGGINEDSSKKYLALKNVIAVGGSWFQKDFISKRV